MSNRIVLYDSNCSFCVAFISLIKRKTRGYNLTFMALQTKEARFILKEKEEQFISLQTVYFIDGIKKYKFSSAVFKMLELTSYPLKVVIFFSIFPRNWTDLVYKFIAKNRFFFGKN